MDHPHSEEGRKRPSLQQQIAGTMFDAPAPALTREDNHRLDAAAQRVLEFMRDGKPHTIREIREVGGSSGDRRLRELREAGYRIAMKPSGERGVYLYTLIGGPAR